MSDAQLLVSMLEPDAYERIRVYNQRSVRHAALLSLVPLLLIGAVEGYALWVGWETTVWSSVAPLAAVSYLPIIAFFGVVGALRAFRRMGRLTALVRELCAWSDERTTPAAWPRPTTPTTRDLTADVTFPRLRRPATAAGTYNTATLLLYPCFFLGAELTIRSSYWPADSPLSSIPWFLLAIGMFALFALAGSWPFLRAARATVRVTTDERGLSWERGGGLPRQRLAWGEIRAFYTITGYPASFFGSRHIVYVVDGESAMLTWMIPQPPPPPRPAPARPPQERVQVIVRQAGADLSRSLAARRRRVAGLSQRVASRQPIPQPTVAPPPREAPPTPQALASERLLGIVATRTGIPLRDASWLVWNAVAIGDELARQRAAGVPDELLDELLDAAARAEARGPHGWRAWGIAIIPLLLLVALVIGSVSVPSRIRDYQQRYFAALPTRLHAQPPRYRDTLAHPTGDWQLASLAPGNGHNATYTGGALRLNSAANAASNTSVAAWTTGSYGDAAVEVTAREIGTPADPYSDGVGLLVRASDRQGVAFIANNDGAWRFYRYDPDRRVLPWSYIKSGNFFPAPGHDNTPIRLLLVMRGASYLFYVNDEYAGSFTDDELDRTSRAGRVGVIVLGQPSAGVFTNFVVYPVSSPPSLEYV
jgi:hypothetical protein